jgi:hypothetical protein
VGFLGRLLLGTGTLRPQLRAELEAEGLVLLEEGLRATLHYKHFKAPGRRHHGKVTPQRVAVAVSEERLVVYASSGRVKLADTPFASADWDKVAVDAADGRVEIVVDYDRDDDPKVSGEIQIRIHTPNADAIAHEVRIRLGR